MGPRREDEIAKEKLFLRLRGQLLFDLREKKRLLPGISKVLHEAEEFLSLPPLDHEAAFREDLRHALRDLRKALRDLAANNP